MLSERTRCLLNLVFHHRVFEDTRTHLRCGLVTKRKTKANT